jgi:hypothetical protein
MFFFFYWCFLAFSQFEATPCLIYSVLYFSARQVARMEFVLNVCSIYDVVTDFFINQFVFRIYIFYFAKTLFQYKILCQV